MNVCPHISALPSRRNALTSTNMPRTPPVCPLTAELKSQRLLGGVAPVAATSLIKRARGSVLVVQE
jgi:hypothetical protein